MNTLKSYLFLLFGSVLFISCNKEFLETNPTDRVSTQTAFSTIGNARKALNGTYRLLYTQYTNQHRDGQGAIMINMETMGEDYVRTNSSFVYFLESYKWLAHRNSTDVNVNGFAYYFYYIIISNVNSIIENVDKLEGSEAEKKTIKGESLALRAWAHFQLVQLYGKRYNLETAPNKQPGIPIVLITDPTGQPRSSVEDVYLQINSDLDEAIELLTGAPARPNKTHVNINVAKGFKARVALTMQNWLVAAKFAREARQGFESLMSNAQYLEGFTNINNPEWMWGIVQLPDQVPTFGSFYTYMIANYNTSFVRLNPKCMNSKLYPLISETDIRKKLWWDGSEAEKPNFGTIDPQTGGIAVGQLNPKPLYMHRKFRVPNPASKAGDISYMRSAEMYLIEAEAEARSGLETAAQKLYIVAKNRDKEYQLSQNTGKELIDEILIQRRIELWGEGFRFLDLKRTNSDLDRRNTNHKPDVANILYVAAGDNSWQWLIPQSEIDANAAITQADQNP